MMKITPLVLLFLLETLSTGTMQARDSTIDTRHVDSQQATLFLRKVKLEASRKLSSGLCNFLRR
jgi:hypothetical protein